MPGQKASHKFSPLVYLILVLITATVLSTPASAEEPGAADLHLKALEALPHSDAELKTYANWSDEPLDKSVLDLVARLAPVRNLLHRATEAGKVDWGWDYSLGPDLRVPELGMIRTFSEAAALWTRADFEAGRFDEGIATSLDMLVLARRLDATRLVLAGLLGTGFETQTIHLVAAYLPRMPGMSAARLESALATVPPKQSLGRALASEMKADEGYLLQKAQNGTANEQMALADNLRAYQLAARGAARLADLPPPQAAAESAAYQIKRAKLPKPMQDLAIKNPEHLAFFNAKQREEWELFRTALEVRQHGPASVASSKDPVDGKPFEYAPIPGGFRLTGCLLDSHSQPVSLATGPEALQ